MFYIVQKNLFLESEFLTLTNALDILNLEYELVDVLPFIETINFKTKRNDIFCFGALKMARISKVYNWNPGCIMTENHDFNVYKNYYKENLLNHDSKIYKFGDQIDFKNKSLFIRPTKDTKVFSGKVFDQKQWNELKEFALTNGYSQTLDVNTEIQVSQIKYIQKEFRFFIVDGKIVTGSLYKLNGRFATDSLIDNGAIDFCNEMLKVYQLADSFVIDICLINDNDWKIVECGCINCAGFYKADIAKLLVALENYYNKIYINK